MVQAATEVHVAQWGNDPGAHRPFTSSTALLGDAAALRRRMGADGYLYLPGLLDPAELTALRAEILGACAAHGWLAPGTPPLDGIACGPPRLEGDPAYFAVYDDVQRLERFHRLRHHPALLALLGSLFEAPLFPHPLAVCRLAFPNAAEHATPPHQDYPNNQGSVDTYAAWTPLGACPRALGSIAVLQGSHRFGLLPMRASRGAGSRTTMPRADLEALPWVSGDFAVGDVLVFHSLTVHRSLANRTADRLRVSVDYRYSALGEPVSDMVLRPHFSRLDWEDVYRGWQSRDGCYYWRDLPLTVVPFEMPPPVDPLELAQQAEAAARGGWLARLRARWRG